MRVRRPRDVGEQFGAAGEGSLRLSYAIDRKRLGTGLGRLEAFMRDRLDE